jgi:hypothetical protein
MGASLQLATSNNKAPTAGDDGCIDLTWVTVADWVRVGAQEHSKDFFVLWINVTDSQSHYFSLYNVLLTVSPSPQERRIQIQFSYLGLPVEIQETDSKGKKHWTHYLSLPLDRVPTRAAQAALLKRKVRFSRLYGLPCPAAWPTLLDLYFRMLETALDKLEIQREDIIDVENLDE